MLGSNSRGSLDRRWIWSMPRPIITSPHRKIVVIIAADHAPTAPMFKSWSAFELGTPQAVSQDTDAGAVRRGLADRALPHRAWAGRAVSRGVRRGRATVPGAGRRARTGVGAPHPGGDHVLAGAEHLPLDGLLGSRVARLRLGRGAAGGRGRHRSRASGAVAAH